MARVILLLLALALVACRPSAQEQRTVRFKLDADGFASLQIKDAAGHIVRQLATAQAFPKGPQQLLWDGLDDAQHPVPPGEYHWSGATHTGIHAKLRGWACADFGAPWRDASVKPPWGGDMGVPSAVAADGERVYLAWSGAILGTSVLACDLEGQPLWGWRDPRGPGEESVPTGVKALAVDAGVVTVLGGSGPLFAEGTQLFRLDARTGAPIPWPENRELTIRSLWPADGKSQPEQADGMAARAGRIYLTFTQDQFLAVLDAQTGAYLQTVVGAPPELIDAVPTKTESPDRPGTLMDADFALVSLRGGVIGKVLFAHDPLWVVTSEMQPLDREERITALTVIGDGARVHQHSVFVGLGAPFYQVQRRAILDTEGFLWSAGRAGGRQIGPWVPEALGPIRGVALDARGRLWVAEGDATPPRFSVWETDGTEGRLVREFFGPTPLDVYGAEVVPGEPEYFIGAGCEWHFDPQTSRARCTAVLTRNARDGTRFHQTAEGKWELRLFRQGEEVEIFERLGEGHYEFRKRTTLEELGLTPAPGLEKKPARVGEAVLPAGRGQIHFQNYGAPVEVLLADQLLVARLFEAPQGANASETAERPLLELPTPGDEIRQIPGGWTPLFTQMPDGRVYGVSVYAGLWNMEITGLDSIRPLPGGKLRVRPDGGKAR